MKTTAPATQILQALEQEVSHMLTTLQELKAKIGRDDLTGLLRRDDFFGRLEGMFQNHGQEVAVLMVDIDNFKILNDTEGHQMGDHVIKRVAQIIQRCSKAGSTSGRYGGEEFIIAHQGDFISACALGEALRRQIEREVCVTVSIGVATASMASGNLSQMVGLADAALYQAKRTGKNKVCLAQAA